MTNDHSLPNFVLSSHHFHLLSAILLHCIWSINPILSRYLQVQASPTLQWYILLSSAKFIAMLDLCLWIMFGGVIKSILHRFFPPTKLKEKEETHVLEHIDEINSEVNTENNNADSYEDLDQEENRRNLGACKDRIVLCFRKKIVIGLAFGTVATCRASTNVASGKFTKAYNVAIINSLSPLMISLADSYFLGTQLPKSLWPSVVMTFLSCSLVAYAQSSLMNRTNVHDNDEFFTTSDAIGCFISFVSVCLSVVARLMMKTTKEVLSSVEVILCSHFVSFFTLFSYSMLTNPYEWLVFEHLSIHSYFALLGTGVLIYTFAGPMQVDLIRRLGPGLYSSLGGIRVIGAVVFSASWLNEPVRNWLEWVGIALAILTVTFYVSDLSSIKDLTKPHQLSKELLESSEEKQGLLELKTDAKTS